MQFEILVLDDERIVANSLKRILQDDERNIHIATDYTGAKETLANNAIDLMLLDYKLGERDGIGLLKSIKEDYPEIYVIMITAYGNIDVAVEAMKSGAYDFIQKKEKPEFIRFNVQRALDNLRLKKEVDDLKEAIATNKNLPKLITNSTSMKSMLELADEFAKSDSTILISGETGTGKSVLAEYIHNKSGRFNNSFISINCSAIPTELIESELFGYEKGAFTGARSKGKKGLIEQANGGTIFLDEISEINPDMQSKLLHVLEKNEFLRIGAVEPTRVDVRFMAATNSNLDQLVNDKRFRMDLFYRLNVANLNIPPLRERTEDIIPLAKVFIDGFNLKFNKAVTQITEEAETFLRSAYWQGNVRELRNYIERAMLLKKDHILRSEDFNGRTGSPNTYIDTPGLRVELGKQSGKNLLHEAQKQIILQALELADNNISKAAEILGLPRTSLNSCIQRFGIKTHSEITS